MKVLTILIIIAVTVLITLVVLPRIIFKPDIGCHLDSARAKMAPIESVIDTYKQDTGRLPEKLTDLITAPVGLEGVWKGPYLKESQLYDPWDRMYIYNPNGKVSNSGYDIISYGADGKPGGKKLNEDIYND